MPILMHRGCQVTLSYAGTSRGCWWTWVTYVIGATAVSVRRGMPVFYTVQGGGVARSAQRLANLNMQVGSAWHLAYLSGCNAKNVKP